MPAGGNDPSTDPELDQLAQCEARHVKETDSHSYSEINDQLPGPTLTLTNKCEHYKQTTIDHWMFEENQEQARKSLT